MTRQTTRQLLDEYLDNELSPAQRAEIEALLRQNPNASALAEKMKRERALRLAALAAFNPATDDAEAAAVRMIGSMQDAANSPVARIGPSVWLKRFGTIAAGLIILAGAFTVGRITAPETVRTFEITHVIDRTTHLVTYTADGEHKTQSFASATEAQEFVEQLELKHAIGTALASIDQPGNF